MQANAPSSSGVPQYQIPKLQPNGKKKRVEAEAQKPKTCIKKRGGGAKRPVITTVSGAEPVISVFQNCCIVVC